MFTTPKMMSTALSRCWAKRMRCSRFSVKKRAKMINFQRSNETEIMDSEDYTDDELRGDFRNIRLANILTRTYGILIKRLNVLIRKNRLKDFTILDIGTGMADVPLELARHFNVNGTRAKIKGIDPNPRAIKVAKEFINGHRDIEFEAKSVQEFSDNEQFDFVISNHTLHHIPSDDILETLNKMYRMARHGLIISDIRRTKLAHIGASIISKFIRNRLTSNDTPASIRKALSKAELKAVLKASKLENYSVR
ncbi:MAG: methyltransferase domain-containing protein, partial [candidate division Zixibacteria bacterium]|nr:methyltransferase domain-containing protein [candidate division Zixibacteria bacterium]